MLIQKNIDWVKTNINKLAYRNGRLIGRVIGYSNRSEQVLLEHASEPVAYPDSDVPLVAGPATWLVKNCSAGALYDIKSLLIFDQENNKQLKLKEIAWLEKALEIYILEDALLNSASSKQMIEKIEIRLEELILSGNEFYNPSDIFLAENQAKTSISVQIAF